MKKILKDPIAPKEKEDGDNRWSFAAPSYDNRTSCSVSAGNYYGVGFRVPLGKEKAGSIESGPIPQQAACFSPHEIFKDEDRKG